MLPPYPRERLGDAHQIIGFRIVLMLPPYPKRGTPVIFWILEYDIATAFVPHLLAGLYGS